MAAPQIERAVISVSNKLGLADFARGLQAVGVEVFSTGGTGQYLESHGIGVRDIAAYTGFPEMLAGRLKTLHPKIFGGVLCRRDQPSDMAEIRRAGIEPFELVVVNLYPFEATVNRSDASFEEAIEQIDIGGPSLVRAAAKNHEHATVVTHPEQYSIVLEQIGEFGAVNRELRRRLAAEAFAMTAAYDRTIADFFARETAEGEFPTTLRVSLRRKENLRYGENPHQKAALYSRPGASGANLVAARQLNGKELSYNNYLDLDAALTIVRSFPAPSAVVIKHNNPCGAATASSLAAAAQQALEGDPLSAYGSVLGFNRTVDVATAEKLTAPGLFIEAIVAPDYEAAAVGVLTTRPKWRKNVRLMQVGRLEALSPAYDFRPIAGGMLVQHADDQHDLERDWKVVTHCGPTTDQWRDLRFAWPLVRDVKSNAIVVCGGQTLSGVGAGQMSRVDAVEIALRKAGRRAVGAVLASDAFFPFADSIQQAAQAGVAAIIQPGGSIRDEEVIAACNELNLPMVFTYRRHFKH